MSRTLHHRNQKHRHNGEDFWGKRAGNGGGCAGTGPITKQITKRKERMQDKELILKELNCIVL